MNGSRVRGQWAQAQLDQARSIKAELATARANDDSLMIEVAKMKLSRHFDDAAPAVKRIEQAHLPEVVRSYRRWVAGGRKGG